MNIRTLRFATAKRWLLLLLILQAPIWQTACGYVAAGAAGAVIGHEAAEEDEEDE